MSVILAIESSAETASVAIHLGCAGAGPTRRIVHRQASGSQSHSRSILPMVQALLAEAGMPIGRCSAIAFGAGPGSFTGVRTACGLAQGLAYGCDLPVVAVDTLIAVAQACRDACGAADVLVALDARMGEVYWGQYQWHAGRVETAQAGDAGYWEELVTAQLGPPATVVPQGMTLPCGNGFHIYSETLARQAYLGGARVDVIPHATQVATLAQGLFARGAATAARDAQPVYLRNNVALTTAERGARGVGASR